LQEIQILKERLQESNVEKQSLVSEVRSLHSEFEASKRETKEHLQKLTLKLAQKDHDLHSVTERLHQV